MYIYVYICIHTYIYICIYEAKNYLNLLYYFSTTEGEFKDQ